MDLDEHNIVKFYITATNMSYILVNSVRKELNKRLKRHNLNHKHWIVLEMVYFNKATSPTKIADRVGLDISTLSRLLDFMEMRLLITREQYELDGRICVVKLTDQGIIQVKQGLQIFYDIQREFKQSLSASELELIEHVEEVFIGENAKNLALSAMD